ncbi:MAG TPA: hypothetical protein VFO94_16765 [Gammaproteobacteria bacterium]|nr:hypothetical protein [Gammaproteobacteria bacterium]
MMLQPDPATPFTREPASNRGESSNHDAPAQEWRAAPKRKRAIGLLVLAVLWCAPAAFAQTAVAPGEDRERELLDSVAREEARNGSHSEGLIDQLSTLALLYQDRGDAVAAIATIRDLLEVIRANEGLHSLEQVTPIRQMIGTLAARGDAATAWKLQQDLLTLARRHPDDMRTVGIFRESADKKMAALNRFLAGEQTPEVELGCYRSWQPSNKSSCASGGRDETVRAMASDAQRDYADAIAVVLRNERFDSGELRDLETSLLQSIDVARGSGLDTVAQIHTEAEPWRDWANALDRLATWPLPTPEGAVPLTPGTPRSTGGLDYLRGRESLQRQFRYEVASSASQQAQIDAFVRIADWDLLHEQNALALAEYEQVYRLLEGHEQTALREAVFAPPVPVVLPSYLRNPLVTEPLDGASSYIDVQFGVTKLGMSRQVKVLDTTTNTSAAAKRQLVRLIEHNRFRPRAAADGWGRTEPVTVRYYVAAQASEPASAVSQP